MYKLVLAGSAALLLGLATANAAPLRAPTLGDTVSVGTTQVAMDEGMGMRRHMMRRHMMMRHHMMHRGMMRHRMMHHRMMHDRM
ncbi:MAG: hypothetical protein NVS2B5_07410 [Beijerinckiaceae bacterium]